MQRTIPIALLLLLVSFSSRPTPHAWASAGAEPLSMELQAFREYVQVSSIATSPEILISELACGTRLCTQFGLSGLSRNRLMARISGLVTGFGYGADIQAFSFASAQTDFSRVDLRVVVLPGAPRLTPALLQTQAQRFMALLRSITSLSDSTAKYTSPDQIPSGSRVYLLSALRWEHQGNSGTARLLSPPGAPRPTLPSSQGCPIWSLHDVPSASEGPFVEWHQHDLRWTFDCPASKETVK